MRARTLDGRAADVLCVSVGAFGNAFNDFCANLLQENIQSILNRCIVLRLPLVFNVASQKSAISIRFYLFIHRSRFAGANIGNKIAQCACLLKL